MNQPRRQPDSPGRAILHSLLTFSIQSGGKVRVLSDAQFRDLVTLFDALDWREGDEAPRAAFAERISDSRRCSLSQAYRRLKPLESLGFLEEGGAPDALRLRASPADTFAKMRNDPPLADAEGENSAAPQPLPTPGLATQYRASIRTPESAPARRSLSMENGSMSDGVRNLTLNGSMEGPAKKPVSAGEALADLLASLGDTSPDRLRARRNALRDSILREVRAMGDQGNFSEAVAGGVADSLINGGAEERAEFDRCLDAAWRNVRAGKVSNPGGYLCRLFTRANLYRARSPPQAK